MNTNWAFIVARQSFDSEIWNKPSWWWKVWCFIVWNVNYDDTERCKKWEWYFTADDIYMGCKLKKEWIKIKSIHNAIAWLVDSQMLSTQKTTRGMYITVLNYAKYQDLINYKKETEKDKSRTGQGQIKDTISEEWINKKEINNIKTNYEANISTGAKTHPLDKSTPGFQKTNAWSSKILNTEEFLESFSEYGKVTISYAFMKYAIESWIKFTHPLTEQFKKNLSDKIKSIRESKKWSLQTMDQELRKMVDYHATKWNEFWNTLWRINTWFNPNKKWN